MTSKKICVVCHPSAENAIREAIANAGIKDVEIRACKVDMKAYFSEKYVDEIKKEIIERYTKYKDALGEEKHD